MAVTTYAKAITPKYLITSDKEVRRELRAATKRVCDHAAQALSELVGPWHEHHPSPQVKIEESANEIKGSAIIEDDITFFLDGGTKERWAVMSKDWQSKTTVGSLKSGAGRGRAVIRGKQAMMQRGIPAKKGIKARKFSIALRGKYAPEFERDTETVMKNAVQKGQAIKS